MYEPKNWNEVVPYDGRPQLPVGGYVCRISKAEEVDTDNERYLNLYFDIAQGPYAGFYENEYATNPYEDRRWKGVMRAYLPWDNNTPEDERTKSRFKGLINALEKSNADFRFYWDVDDFRDMLIGIVFRNIEWEKDGMKGMTACPYIARSVDAILDGNYRIPLPKQLKSGSRMVEVDDEADLPF